MFDSVRHLNN